MQSKNFKLKFRYNQKNFEFNNNSLVNNKLNFYTFNEGDLIGFTNRLDNIESLLNKLIDKEDKSKFIDDYYNIEKEKYNKRALISYDQSNILQYKDYPKHLMAYYFTFQYHCSNPPILTISEYFQCAQYFNNNIPVYLISAILCRSSLTSPHSQLFSKNIEFSNYYYNLSFEQLNKSFRDGEFDVYMLYTIFILFGVDQALNRQSNKGMLLVKVIKIVQVLGIDDLENNPLFNHLNLSPSTIKKLLLYVRYYNNEACKLFNMPTLIKYRELKFEDFNIDEEEKFGEIIDFQVNNLSKDYYLAFKSLKTIFKILYPKSHKLHDSLFIDNASNRFKECFDIIERIYQVYNQLPAYIKFSKDCLNNEKIAEDPLLRVRLLIYEHIIKETARLYKTMASLVDKLSIEKVIYLVEKLVKFTEIPISLLNSQQTALLISGNNSVNLQISSAFFIGNALLELLKKFLNFNIKIESHKLKILKSMVKTEFNRLISLIKNLEPNWDGAKSILNSLLEKFKLISE